MRRSWHDRKFKAKWLSNNKDDTELATQAIWLGHHNRCWDVSQGFSARHVTSPIKTEMRPKCPWHYYRSVWHDRELHRSLAYPSTTDVNQPAEEAWPRKLCNDQNLNRLSGRADQDANKLKPLSRWWFIRTVVQTGTFVQINSSQSARKLRQQRPYTTVLWNSSKKTLNYNGNWNGLFR